MQKITTNFVQKFPEDEPKLEISDYEGVISLNKKEVEDLLEKAEYFLKNHDKGFWSTQDIL